LSGSEILVALFGLFLGYWIISSLMGGKRAPSIKSTDGSGSKDGTANAGDTTGGDKSSPANGVWYEVLNVSRTASLEEVQASYRSLIRQYHPDKVASLGEELRVLAERKSKDINLAYNQALEVIGSRH
jgi:hypothetical protein